MSGAPIVLRTLPGVKPRRELDEADLKPRDTGGGAGVFSWRPTLTGGAMVRYGRPAPEFTLPSTEGRPLSLSEFRGRDVVLIFYCYAWGSI